ncbi:MAG TPA: hypothetical protein VF100_13755 [Thermoanaerobaculia bacterium]
MPDPPLERDEAPADGFDPPPPEREPTPGEPERDEPDGAEARGAGRGELGRADGGAVRVERGASRAPATTRRAGGADSTPRRSLRGGTTTEGRPAGARERGERA